MIVAATQLALSVPAILYGHDHSAPVHLAHEMGSFDVAVAVGLLVAAYRPGRSVGMLSLLGAAAALLVVTASVDLVAGRTSVGDESPHVLVVAGWLLVRWLAAVVPPTFERPGGMLHGLRAAADAVARLGRQPGGRPEAPSVGYGDEIVASLSSSALWKPDVRKGGEALPGHRAAG
ncbi:MAG TPA: hypothetical protein VND62_05185 [Acidimicrobiales bacterium]|nr:hypothetical protein [Acidimicrobiales bacterium]